MIDATKAYQFYILTEERVTSQAQSKGISDLNKYYSLTDFYGNSVFNTLRDKAQVFAQIAFHAQNATLISNIVRFEKNYSFLKSTLCDFNPEAFLLKYSDPDRENSVNQIVEDLRYDGTNNPNGLHWNTGKSKQENKDTIVKRYANMLLDAAIFLEKFNNRNEFLNDLKNHYPNKNHETLIKYFRENISHGFSIALTCDFLKELDSFFSDLPKPDVHIKDILIALFGYEDNHYNTEKKEYQCIKDLQKITSLINQKLTCESQPLITVYQLDRMIWLACTDNFFLDFTENTKDIYLQNIINL